MAGILRAGPSLWFPGQVKPGGIPKIDWTHPLANGLVAYWFDTGAGTYQDLVTGRMMATVSNNSAIPIPNASSYGTGFKFTVSKTQMADPAAAVQQSWSAPYSVAAGIFILGASSGTVDTGYFGLMDGTGNDPFNIYAVASTTIGISFGNAAAPSQFTYTNNTFYAVVGAATGASAQSVWINGIAQTAGTGTSAFSGSGMHYAINTAGGSYNNAVNTGFCNAFVFFGAAWLRALTQSEAILLYTDPYCLLMPWEGEMPALFSGAGVQIGQPQGRLFVPGYRFSPAGRPRSTFAYPPSVAATIALLAQSFTMATGRLLSSGTVPLLARGTEESTGRNTPSGTVPLQARGTEEATGRNQPSGAVPLQARGTEESTGRNQPAGTLPIQARGQEISTGRIQPSGVVPLQARGTEEATGRNQPSGAVPLLARGTEEATGRNQTTGVVPLSARGEEISTGRIQPSGVVSLTVRQFTSSATTIVTQILTVALQAFGRVMATARALTSGTTPLSARGTEESTGRNQPSGIVPLLARGTEESTGRNQPSGIVPLLARGVTQAKAFVPFAGLAKLLARGVTITTGRAATIGRVGLQAFIRTLVTARNAITASGIVIQLTALMGGGYPRKMYGSFAGKAAGGATAVFEWLIRARRRGRR